MTTWAAGTPTSVMEAWGNDPANKAWLAAHGYPVSGGSPTPTPQPAPAPTTQPSPMQQQLGTGPAAPQPYTPQVGAPTTPAPNPFQPFMDAMQQYQQQFAGLKDQYAQQIADYNQQYNQQAQAQTQQQNQQVADYNRQFSGQLPPISVPQPQSVPQPTASATPPAAPPQQFPGAAPQGFPGPNTNPFSEALGGYGSGGVGFGGWNQPQRRQRPQSFGFGGRSY